MSPPDERDAEVVDTARSGADAAVDRGRRRVLGTLAAAAGATVCVGAALPGFALVRATDAGGAGEGRWLRALALADLADGVPRRVALVADARDAWTLEKNVELGAVWLERRGAEVRAWSSACPHLGCSIQAGADGSRGFTCPCHASVFSPDGAPVSGPSRRAMDALDTRVENGWVMVDFKRFRLGVPEKVAVG